MAKFVQIGNSAINIDLVTYVHFSEFKDEDGQKCREATLWCGAGENCSFIGSDGQAFCDWWGDHAEVHVCP